MTTAGTFWQRRWRPFIVGGACLFVVLTVQWFLWPRNWTVTIVSTPPGVRVLNEARVIGTTPLAVNLPPIVTSTLTLQLEGYETENIVLDPALRQSSVTFPLVPRPLKYTVNVQPPHAVLSVLEPGATLEGRILTFAQPDGERTFTLVAKLDNFADIVTTVRPGPGQTDSLDITFPARFVFDFPQLAVPFTVRCDTVELPGGKTQLFTASNANGHRLQITAGGISFVDRKLTPNFPGDTIPISVPPPAAVYKVGRLPLGIGLKATATAGVAMDSNGCHWVVVPGNGGSRPADVIVSARETLMTTLVLPQLNPATDPPVEWALYEIDGGAGDTTLIVQGEGSVLRHPDDRKWLLVPRPDGKRWVKLSAVRPGFKEIARLLIPLEGERSSVRLDTLLPGKPFEYALPEDVVAFVNVSDYGSFKRRLNELRGVKLCQSPVMQPFVSRFLGKSEQSIGKIQEQTGIDVVKLCAAHTGQMVLAWTGTPTKPGGFFLSDVPGSRGIVQAMLDDMHRIGKVADGFISVIDNDILLGTTDSTLARQVVARLGNMPVESFALNPRLKQFRQRAGGTGDFEVFVDLKRINDLRGLGGKAEPDRIGGWFDVSALRDRQFESAGISCSIAQDEFDTLCHLILLTNGRPALFQKLLAMPQQSMQPEPWVPADVTGYYTFTWDRPALEPTLRFFFGVFPLGNRLTLVTDFTESRGFLVPRVLLAWNRTKVPNANFSAIHAFQEQLLAITSGLSSADTVMLDSGSGETLIYQNFDGLLKPAKGGHTILFRDYGGLLEKAIGNDKPVPVGKVALVATESHVMLATHIELLQKILKHQGPGLAASPDYLRVAAHFPKECSLMTYQAPDQSRLLFQALKTGRLPGFVPEGMELFNVFSGLIEALDGSQLPDYDAVKHFMTPAGGYGIMDDSGFHYTYFSLNR